MTDAPSGPPMQLLTRHERRRRRRAAAIGIVLIGSVAVALFAFVLGIATKEGSEAHLGSTTFKVGRASEFAKRIKKDNYPLLFQDLQDNSKDIYVQHLGANHLTRWRAIEAHAPDAPRSCQLQWTGDEFKDPCDGTIYPADGTGLRQFKVNVVDGVLYVNFRQVIEPGA